MEFLTPMELLVEKYTPETLPYHFIVPSLPDYGLSGGPSQNVEMTLNHAARVMNKLMTEIGFKGYVAQGGDIGSMLARIMSAQYQECKAFHLNIFGLKEEEKDLILKSATPDELGVLKRADHWRKTGMAYALEHGTRPATIGLVLSTSPLALLSWLGEKFIEWADKRNPLALDDILAAVTLYWLTSTLPRSLYPYRAIIRDSGENMLPISKQKPFGYSLYPYEIDAVPQRWLEKNFPNLVFYRAHTSGGHFASLEEPETFLTDIEDFVKKVSAIVRVD